MSSPISGFTAIPNPQMLAFMPIQSYLMMYFAGSGWQYGKRKISAMSNEQFNKLTPEELLQQHSIELKNMLPTLEKSLNDVTPLVRILIEQYGDFIKAAIAAVPSAIQKAGIPILTGQAKIDYDKQFFDFFKNFGTIPEAEARIGGGARDERPTIDFNTSDSSREGVGSTSRDKPFGQLHKEQGHPGHDHRADQIEQFGKTLVTPQLSLIEKSNPKKRKAGQSQIITRNQLIKSIASEARLFRNPVNAKMKEVHLKRLKGMQQQLVNLLARYRFT